MSVKKGQVCLITGATSGIGKATPEASDVNLAGRLWNICTDLTYLA